MKQPHYRYTVYFRETPNSPQWEDIFEKGSTEENKALADKRAYEICIDGGLAVVVPSVIYHPTIEIPEY